MAHLLMSLDLSGRRVVCVGGGRVGTRRARMFAEAGARVVVVSPQVTDELATLAGGPGVDIVRRAYLEGDLTGAWLAHTATGVAAVDAQVSAEAERLGVFCVDATDAARATAHVPARRRVAEVNVAVHADGDHVRARQVADRIAGLLGPDRSACPQPS